MIDSDEIENECAENDHQLLANLDLSNSSESNPLETSLKLCDT